MAKINFTPTCWLWKAAINNSGYGVFGLGSGVVQNAHRASYEHWKEKIPKGLEIDHICHVKSCVNPDHIRVVTHTENMATAANAQAAMTHCKRGHSLDDYYVAKRPGGRGYSRRCRECHKMHLRVYMRKFRARKRAEKLAP